MSEHCPCCGAEVRVCTADEGTSHYEPIGDEIARVLADRVDELEYSRWLNTDRTMECRNTDDWIAWAREQVTP